jgi:hypothetical protein
LPAEGPLSAAALTEVIAAAEMLANICRRDTVVAFHVVPILWDRVQTSAAVMIPRSSTRLCPMLEQHD